MLRRLLSSAAALGVIASGSTALAVDATPCTDEPLTCQSAPLSFSREKALPIDGGFDTGFIPQGSPLQVRLFAQLFASTAVELNGALRTSWPEVLELETPGTPQGGSLGIHYGVEVGAEAKVQVSVLGQNYSWTGPVPFVPQFDWQVEASEAFDPWAFTGFAVNGSTQTETLFQVDVLDFIGINIPGLSGSLDLDVAMDLDARYRTQRILITHVDGEPVEGGPIEGFGQTSLAQYLGGPSVDLDVTIDGQVRYNGVLHLVPTFSIETIGPDFSIPIVDVPVPFTYTDDHYDFEAVRVHIPLPDIELEGEDGGSSGGEFPVEPSTDLSFGAVEVGATRKLSLTMKNLGEASLVTSLLTSDAAFVADALDFEVLPSGETKIEVSFTPPTDGPFDAVLQIASNDPDEPVRTVQLSGEGAELDLGSGAGGGASDDGDLEEGCGCSVVGAEHRSHGGVALLALGFGLALRRRRR